MSEDVSKEDRTEEASPERREEFREKGQIAVSREITSVFTLACAITVLSFSSNSLIERSEKIFITSFQSIRSKRIDQDNLLSYLLDVWIQLLYLAVPLMVAVSCVAIGTTFAQTRLNWSWKKLAPDFNKLNPMKGLARMFSMNSVVELLKGIAKMLAVGIVSYLILKSEWVRMPELMMIPVASTWGYWGEITKHLFWSVAGLMIVIAGGDYLYNFFSMERQMKMTKQEVKEEFKRREVDPHLKGRMRRMQREMMARKTVAQTKEATVVITNPTHYAVALKYELGMPAPMVVAKGVDYLALRMREAAKEVDIPVIENRPLARELYAVVEEGEEIPDKLYKVVAEIIRYVFRLKGRALPKNKGKQTQQTIPVTDSNT